MAKGVYAEAARSGDAHADLLARHYEEHVGKGFYDDLVVPFMDCEEDNNVRRDTTFEKLQSLKPVFDRSAEGTMTAGNSTPLTERPFFLRLAIRISHRLHDAAYQH